MLPWGIHRNIQSSLYDFLLAQVVTDEVTDDKGDNITVRVGRKNDKDWTLPCVTFYVDNETSPRAELGTNNRMNSYLVILDIYATNEGERADVAGWLKESIKNGFRYYAYTPSQATPQTPTKVAGGLVEVDFLTNARVALGQNVDEEDAHRHRISINTWISGT